MSSLEEKILERELTKAQLEIKSLKHLLELRVSYETKMVEKTLRLCEMLGISSEEVLKFYGNRYTTNTVGSDTD